ncbi:hypothetical protein CKO50_01835 [Pseudoalteromonas sp. HM-SA03]|uniref:hypothetical protein n=1 Tax=Pseudoalteromonas sp. HM-SA03 TaxID=2029678 RepID=UPI000BAE2813|nr:hypothetical protein [Pseudoalteromonas sp. HM-SA03]PAY03009.1 hypothetical protein CKO50_01835 [Pseudoalteromonas sp. HM-SA03]
MVWGSTVHAQTTLTEWQKQVENSDFSGVVIAAQQGKVVYQHGFGESNRETKTKFNQQIVFDIVIEPYRSLSCLSGSLI